MARVISALPLGLAEFKIEKSLDGAIRVSIGDRSCILPPDQAIKAASVMLSACGCNVEFKNPIQSVITPRKVLHG